MEPRPDSESPDGAPAETMPVPSQERTRRWRFWPARRGIRVNALAIVATVLFVLLVALWIDTRYQIHNLEQELIRKLAQADSYNRESRQIATQARDSLRDLEYR